MFVRVFRGRRAHLWALFAFILGAALISTAASSAVARATSSGLGSNVESQVIVGSRLRVQVYDEGAPQAWTGHINGPNGATLNWTAPQGFGAAHVVFYQEDLEAGLYTIVPDSPIAPGWHVAGYLAKANVDPTEGCFTKGDFVPGSFSSSPTVNLTAQNHSWVICIGVVQDGSIWDSRITVAVGGSDPTAAKGTGKLMGPGFNEPFSMDFLGDNAGGQNVAPGMYYLILDEPPAAGYVVAGYYAFESKATNPTCSANPAAYSGLFYAPVSQEHPNWVICYRLVKASYIPNSSLTVGIVATVSAGQNSWQGTVTGPSGITWSWMNNLQIGGPNYQGGRHDIPAGTYLAVPGKPVRQGWEVKGYASFETTQFLQACPPVASGVYSMKQTPVTFSDAHSNWAICVLVAPTEPPPTVALPTTHVSDDLPTFNPPSGGPASTPVPTLTTVPTSVPGGPGNVPAGTATKPVQTQTSSGPDETAQRPGGDESGGISRSAFSTPVAPSTGTGEAHHGHQSLPLVLGALFILSSALIVTATRLPGRRTR